MTLISVVLLPFEHFGFLLPVRSNLVPRINCSSILMKIRKMNNEITPSLVIQLQFDDFNF